MKTNEEIETTDRDDLARVIKASPKPKGTRIEKLRSVVAQHQAARVEGTFIDALTASMLVQVHDALNESNQKKFLGHPLKQMIVIGWKLVG